MFKQVCFFKRRPGMTMAQFIDYYENMHSKLPERLGLPAALPNAKRYIRRFIHEAEKNPITLEKVHPGYDCVMEIWWDNREAFEAAMQGLRDPTYLAALKEDERQFFSTNSNPVCSVEECDSPLGPDGTTVKWVPVAEGEAAPKADALGDGQVADRKLFKQVCFFKKRPDMTMEQFKDYYENGHSKLAKKIGAPFLPGALRYVRRYLTVEKNPVTLEKLDPGYDCIMEIWWKSRADFEKAMVGVHDPKFLDKRMEDEKKLFASHNNPVVHVEESETALGPNGTMLRWMPTLA